MVIHRVDISFKYDLAFSWVWPTPAMHHAFRQVSNRLWTHWPSLLNERQMEFIDGATLNLVKYFLSE